MPFVLYWYPSVCQCLSLYNVRAYMCVRLNVYKYKIMLIGVNSFGYMKIVSYLCNVKREVHIPPSRRESITLNFKSYE